MAGHVIASFLEDFADIKVSHALSLSEKCPPPLRPQNNNNPPPPAPHALFETVLLCSTPTAWRQCKTAQPDATTLILHPLKSNTVLRYGSLVSISV